MDPRKTALAYLGEMASKRATERDAPDISLATRARLRAEVEALSKVIDLLLKDKAA